MKSIYLQSLALGFLIALYKNKKKRIGFQNACSDIFNIKASFGTGNIPSSCSTNLV